MTVDDQLCECGHIADEHIPAPGGHPGECQGEVPELGEPCLCMLFEGAAG